MYSILCRNSETNIYYVNTWKKIKIKYLSFLRHVYFVYGHLQTFCALFAYMLLGFCFLPVLLPLLLFLLKKKWKHFAQFPCSSPSILYKHPLHVKTFFFNTSLTFSTVILFNLRRFC